MLDIHVHIGPALWAAATESPLETTLGEMGSLPGSSFLSCHDKT